MKVVEPANLSADIAHRQATFDRLVEALLSDLQPSEQAKLELTGEQSQFVRFNSARVRQTGCITDGEISLTLMGDRRNAYRSFPFTGNWETDWQQATLALAELRQEVPQLPEDPYLVLPEGNATSHEVHMGNLLPPEQVTSAILPEVSGLDFTGIYAAGSQIRAFADSAGQKHWFATESFALDYSLFTADGQAVKGTFAGNEWDAAAYSAKLATSKQQLERLARSPQAVPRGQYRTYLAPSAVADLLGMFSWGGVSESALQRGDSALAMLQRGEKKLSAHFTLSENFRHGLVPRFNDWGEIAPIELPLIHKGELVNTLVNSRTAKEYGKIANGANGGESLRSPDLSPGTLAAAQILQTLGTGLYLSNLHYLNWSDRPTGRVTGMTRYACFWVEEGEIVAPIENLRFDESLYRCFGESLAALTDFQEFIPEVGTYDLRSLGGVWAPGLIVDGFTYTL
ncbi:MAG: TldD/PmbA family protein [Oscillatoriophycideae cyanobacterium NC_groundwater_1537_Pr4_S-0.65um_50_18]|nr:TldD/PmbA family protein [Oscillatoriophycideae cyanobacterium NC_groundwater_1537_Pr4_S-0.65um_50_18]